MKRLFTLIYLILAAQYSYAQYSYPTFSYPEMINNVQFNSLINYNSGVNSSGVVVYPKNQYTTSVTIGQTYFFQASRDILSGVSYKFSVWIDYNNDSIFSANEIVATSSYGYIKKEINIPNDTSYIGYRRMRVLLAFTPTNPTGNYGDGECEDYTIYITDSIIKRSYSQPMPKGTYYTINQFRLNTLHNCNSVTRTYTLFPDSVYTTDLQIGRTYYILISKGYYAGIGGGFLASIDYNDDHKFTSNEYLAGSTDAVTLRKFTIPNDTNLYGKRRLRVRSRRTYMPQDMDTWYEGETEDYDINIVPYVPDSVSPIPNQWEHIYSQYGNQIANNAYETYDKGYIINGLTGTNLSRYKLQKTNTDGAFLWNKKEKTSMYYYSTDMDLCLDGGEVICGITAEGDPNGASFVRKFGPCGNVEWTTTLGDPNNYDYAYNVVQLKDSGYIVSGRYWGPNSNNTKGRMGLARLNKDGDTLWTKDITIHYGADIDDVIVTKDNSFLCTGTTFWANPNDPSGKYYSRSFVIKVDSMGNMLWNKIVDKDNDLYAGGKAVTEIEGQGYLNLVYAWPKPQLEIKMMVVKTNYQGETIWKKAIDNDVFYHFSPVAIKRIDSNEYVIISNRWDNCDIYFNQLALFVIDSMGNVLHSRILDHFYGKGNDVSVNSDKQLIVSGYKVYNKNYDIYLARFNRDLSLDTFTQIIYTYDTLCDSSVFNFISEPQFIKTGFSLYPNPTDGQITIELLNFKTQSRYDINVYNINGSLLKTYQGVRKSKKELNLGWLKPGIYVIQLENNNGESFNKKLIIVPKE
jgi:hypothetical protein